MAGKGSDLKLTREVIDTLCGWVAKGAPLTVAAKAAKVSRASVYSWIRQADEKGGLFRELRDRLDEVEAQSNIDLIDVVKSCAIENRDWKAAQWLLMARLPEYFNTYRDRSVHHRHEVTGADGGPIQISAEARIDAVIAKMSAEELDVLVRQALSGGVAPALIEGGSTQEAPPLHQVLDARVPDYPTLREISRSPGGGGEWDDQEIDRVDAAATWEELDG